jgi:hypothetical protein
MCTHKKICNLYLEQIRKITQTVGFQSKFSHEIFIGSRGFFFGKPYLFSWQASKKKKKILSITEFSAFVRAHCKFFSYAQSQSTTGFLVLGDFF